MAKYSCRNFPLRSKLNI